MRIISGDFFFFWRDRGKVDCLNLNYPIKYIKKLLFYSFKQNQKIWFFFCFVLLKCIKYLIWTKKHSKRCNIVRKLKTNFWKKIHLLNIYLSFFFFFLGGGGGSSIQIFNICWPFPFQQFIIHLCFSSTLLLWQQQQQKTF